MNGQAKHSQGPWREGAGGNQYGAVVSDQPINRPYHRTDEDREREREAYGGYLIAESILPCNRPVISAAPDMYDALVFTRSVLISNGIFEASERLAIEKIDAALAKANGGRGNP